MSMNIALTLPADELPPHRAFTVEDIRRMMDAGVFGDNERFELIEGEIFMMSPKGVTHENIKHALTLALARAAPDGFYVGVESTLQLADDILVEPDLSVISRDVYKAPAGTFAQPRASDVLLLIEVAVSSMAYDRKVKAALYARYGIQEFWVIDGDKRVTWVHTGPSGDGWASIVERGPRDLLTTAALPDFSIRLADI
jgi:Uma2 family endonuclease